MPTEPQETAMTGPLAGPSSFTGEGVCATATFKDATFKEIPAKRRPKARPRRGNVERVSGAAIFPMVAPTSLGLFFHSIPMIYLSLVIAMATSKGQGQKYISKTGSVANDEP